MIKSLRLFLQWTVISPGLLLSVPPILAQDIPILPITAVGKSCAEFKPLTNIVAPSESLLEQDQSLPFPTPTSACAADLVIPSPGPDKLLSQRFVAPPAPIPDPSQGNAPLSLQRRDNPDDWRFTFQPYVTVPVSVYGSATVKGRTVDYRLGLGSLL
ncbi:MAG: hypothetical protein GC158_09265 [Cyanobacteria bacterium RI_101]|nr:hypothetical protein [Cyanobacteria bacterium RI_101]